MTLIQIIFVDLRRKCYKISSSCAVNLKSIFGWFCFLTGWTKMLEMFGGSDLGWGTAGYLCSQ